MSAKSLMFLIPALAAAGSAVEPLTGMAEACPSLAQGRGQQGRVSQGAFFG